MTHPMPATTARTTTSAHITRIAGAVVVAQGLIGARLYDVVYVGHDRLIGEIIRLQGTQATIQVYEDTMGLRVGDPVWHSGAPLQVELGPGLLGGIFDGVQRPLPGLEQMTGGFIGRGVQLPGLDRERKWPFEPQVAPGDEVSPGDIIGNVPERPHLPHRIMVPPGVRGRVDQIREGEFTVTEAVAAIDTGSGVVELTLMQRWPVREPRPYREKLDPTEPLITGQRVLDTFFPIAKGGTAIIPGGFGTGKTVTQQSLAKWAHADVIIYVGCGERGNEMAEVLTSFPELEDPRFGGPLMHRTILIANTSNMPVAAREASIYTGITIAEYYRDMGYDVALMADSTSRWGEALREVSGRLEEMPGEEGYPAYLPARLAEFYERAGRVACLQGQRDGGEPRMGSVTVIGAVSPPGGDFSEPITQHSLRIAGTFWALDIDLARRRHFPAINWRRSYTLYNLSQWFQQEVAPDWEMQRHEAETLLQREAELQETIQIVGADALGEPERAILHVGAILREDFLRQSAFSDDASCPLVKQYWMLKTILHYYRELDGALRRGMPLQTALELPLRPQLSRMREWTEAEAPDAARELMEQISAAFSTHRPAGGTA